MVADSAARPVPREREAGPQPLLDANYALGESHRPGEK